VLQAFSKKKEKNLSESVFVFLRQGSNLIEFSHVAYVKKEPQKQASFYQSTISKATFAYLSTR